VGAKMIAESWLHLSVATSLAVVLGMLILSGLVSLLVKKKAASKA